MRLKDRLLLKNDNFFYAPMTEELLHDLNNIDKKPVSNGNSYLYRILNWYLFYLLNDVK